MHVYVTLCFIADMSGPSFSAYSFTNGGFGNMTAADKVPPEMAHLIDAHW